jgi:hypothetical protein
MHPTFSLGRVLHTCIFPRGRVYAPATCCHSRSQDFWVIICLHSECRSYLPSHAGGLALTGIGLALWLETLAIHVVARSLIGGLA